MGNGFPGVWDGQRLGVKEDPILEELTDWGGVCGTMLEEWGGLALAFGENIESPCFHN